MFPRCLFATASGVAATFGLFLLMQGFIESDQSPFNEAQSIPCEQGRPSLAQANDDDLMADFAAGDYPAFEGLYNRHRDAPRADG